MRTSVSDDSQPPEVAEKVRRAIKILADRNPALCEAPIAFLTLYAQEFEGSKCVDRSPALQYCLRQCFLGFQDVCRLIEKRKLKTGTLRENIMNLIALGNLMGTKHPETVEPVCAQLVKLIAMLEELDSQLADASGLPPVDWSSIVSSLKATSNAQKKNFQANSVTVTVPPLEDFTVLKTLGRGGFGAVYRGLFRETLDVAIKIVSQTKLRCDSKSESAYIDKMLASAVPNHPFICRMYSAFMASGRSNPSTTTVAVTVMEAIDGADIAELVNRVQSLSYPTVMSIIEQLLMAIEHIHFAGFIHRDIKLANILLSRDGRVKVIDFDINKLCIALAGSQHQISFFARTATEFFQGEKAGTEAYMAPEVHQSKAFGRASDWWSVGVVFFRLTFGRLPFRGQDLTEEIVNSEIEWSRLRTFPEGTPSNTNLNEVISSFLNKDPKKRLGSKDYNNIFEHRLFAETEWNDLPNSVSLTEDMEYFFSSRDNDSHPAAKAPPPAPDDQIFSLDDLIDYRGEHQKLFTYTSPLVRQLLSDAHPSGSVLDERDIRDESMSFRHCQHLTRVIEETTCAITTTDERKQIKGPEQVILQEFNQSSCLRRIQPVRCQRLLCEDGMYRFTVTEIDPGLQFLSQSKLLYGDLLWCIDKISLTNLTLDRIQKLFLKRGAPIVVTVAPGNAFRDIEEGTFKLENYSYTHKPRSLQFKSSKKRCRGYLKRQYYHGFDLIVRKLVSKNSWEAYCLVSSHDLTWQRCGSDMNIFTGDIVLAINHSRLDKVARNAKADELLSEMLDRPQVNLEFVPCSVLRMNNLPRE